MGCCKERHLLLKCFIGTVAGSQAVVFVLIVLVHENNAENKSGIGKNNGHEM